MTGDRAVSAVLGTVLMLAVIVGAIALYQITVVPNQTEKAEAQQMATVERGMNALTADVLDRVAALSHAPSSTPVTLSRDEPLLGAEETATGSLSFDAEATTTTVVSPSLNIVTRDGESQLSGSGAGGEWQPADDGETIEDIHRIIGLRIKITDASPSDNDRLRLVATDADGDYAGDLQAIVRVSPPNLDLIVQTQAPPEPGEVVFHNQLLTTHRDRWDAHYWLDPMLDLYWFEDLLADADKPATLTFEDLGLDAEYKVSYRRQVTSDLTTVVGAGQVEEDYGRTHNSGTLVYQSQNEFFPDQELSVDHGALVRSQAEGAAFAIDPPFQADAGGGFVKLGLDVPSLAGDTDAISGTNVATVRTLTTEHTTFGATAGELEIAFETDHPDLWAGFLERELTDAGLTSDNCPPTSPDSPCQFETSTSSGGVEVEVHGPHATDADPQDPERDIFLQLQRGTIETELQR